MNIQELYLEYINENSDITDALCKELTEQYQIEDESDKEVFTKALKASVNETVLSTLKDFIDNRLSDAIQEHIDNSVFEAVDKAEYKSQLILEKTIDRIVEEYKPYMKTNVVNEYNKAIVDTLIESLERYNIHIPEEKLDYCNRLEHELMEINTIKEQAIDACDERDNLLKSYMKKDIIRKSMPDKSEVEINRMYELTESFSLDYNNLNKYKDHILFVEKTYVQKPMINEQRNNSSNNKMPRLI